MAIAEQPRVFVGSCYVVCSSGRQLLPFFSQRRKRFVPHYQNTLSILYTADSNEYSVYGKFEQAQVKALYIIVFK